jgi:hypothetical protein
VTHKQGATALVEIRLGQRKRLWNLEPGAPQHAPARRPAPAELSLQRTAITLGLFAAWACHDLEELVTMRETSRAVAARMPNRAPIPDDVRQNGLSQHHLNLAISLISNLRRRSVGCRRSLAGAFAPRAGASVGDA